VKGSPFRPSLQQWRYWWLDIGRTPLNIWTFATELATRRCEFISHVCRTHEGNPIQSEVWMFYTPPCTPMHIQIL
jgi:hypothetical protein